MITFYRETSLVSMGNGSTSGEKRSVREQDGNDGNYQMGIYNRIKNNDELLFYAGTDKARIISEILEGRGWSRTRDQKGTNFTIKWCLAHQVDWTQFQEGKQLVNNIPGQLIFSDKINLWYTIRDYLNRRRTNDGNHIQTFLPLTFVLDNENEVAEFLRSFKKQNRTWICKPRYSFAGRGIYVITGSSDLNTVFKFKVTNTNRLQHQPRLPGYLMQEYIARPLLIKGRKFDIRVHWLVAWTKPLLVFYNHAASVVRLSLNLYREFDFDRATHLTNLSVQEQHARYAFSQEATGMTMQQLNHYFNQCFRPFHPKMCQDWVMTVMQERMQTIIRHVIRASKDKLARHAGQFGFFGCDFLLDENFRIWLLEINDNPGVGWGNSRLNTTTKPLFEETLDIVFECFDKFQNARSLLPIECLKNYQLIYNEDDDQTILRDDNQVVIERLSLRYAMKDPTTPRSQTHRSLPRVNTARVTSNPSDQSDSSQNDSLPSIDVNTMDPTSTTPISSTTFISPSLQPISNTIETIEPLKHQDDIELERLMKPKTMIKSITPLQSSTSINRSVIRIHRPTMKRALSTTTPVSFQRKKRIDLTPVTVNNRRYVNRTLIIPKSTETSNKSPLKAVALETENPVEENDSVVSSSVNVDLAQITSIM